MARGGFRSLTVDRVGMGRCPLRAPEDHIDSRILVRYSMVYYKYSFNRLSWYGIVEYKDIRILPQMVSGIPHIFCLEAILSDPVRVVFWAPISDCCGPAKPLIVLKYSLSFGLGLEILRTG